MNLKFKSSEPDLKFNIQSQIEILMKNVLYLTHEVDQIKRVVIEIRNSQRLQKQVDDYFEDESSRNTPGNQETSPQTDTVEQ